MKKICILFCGGTITMKRNKQGTLSPFYDAEGLLKLVPQLNQLAAISAVQVINIDSSNVESLLWGKLTQTIYDLYADYDGFLVTHGTDTMAYTATALSFSLRGLNKPIVFTGSQRPLDDVPSDGYNNLINAVTVASRGIVGVSIVFGSKILQANRATKVSESNLDAFDSPMVAPRGEISLDIKISEAIADGVKKNQKLSCVPTFDPRVIVVKVTPGLSPKLLENILAWGCRGLILEGFGPGNLPDALLPVLKIAKKMNLPVVVLSQCRRGMTKMQLYDVGYQALQAGAIPGGDMTVEAATTKLMWVLSQTTDVSEIKRLFQKNIAGEVTIDE